eukprot:Opistho-1_new@66281
MLYGGVRVSPLPPTRHSPHSIRDTTGANTSRPATVCMRIESRSSGVKSRWRSHRKSMRSASLRPVVRSLRNVSYAACKPPARLNVPDSWTRRYLMLSRLLRRAASTSMSELPKSAIVRSNRVSPVSDWMSSRSPSRCCSHWPWFFSGTRMCTNACGFGSWFAGRHTPHIAPELATAFGFGLRDTELNMPISFGGFARSSIHIRAAETVPRSSTTTSCTRRFSLVSRWCTATSASHRMFPRWGSYLQWTRTTSSSAHGRAAAMSPSVFSIAGGSEATPGCWNDAAMHDGRCPRAMLRPSTTR